MMAYKEVNPGIWKPENEGDFIEGIFVRAEEDVGHKGSTLYHLEVEEKQISIWGCTVLDQKMVFVKPADKIRITYKGLGEKQPGKNPAKLFKVEIDRN